MQVQSTAFRAMGTDIEITLVGAAPGEIAAADRFGRDLAERWEQTFSRFRADSELSQLNASAGVPCSVSSDMLWVIEKANAAFQRTNGRFDPSIAASLISTGYDRDFREIKRRTAAVATEPAPGMAVIQIDSANASVVVPIGVQLDFGGIAKGAFVDRLAIALMRHPGGCVDAGGDLRVWGPPPAGDHWVIGIEHPSDPERDIARIEIIDPRAGAIATSAPNRRRWEIPGGEAHHLIDPGTGRPASGNVRSTTAIAATTIDAEIATKSLYMSAARGEPPDPIDAIAGVIVDGGEHVHLVKRRAHDAFRFFPMAPDG